MTYHTLSPTIKLACDLIRLPSITPIDAGCQSLIANRLSTSGFKIELMNFKDVSNIWATHGGDDSGPLLCFAGHTDVVTPGALSSWKYNPFDPVICKNSMLHGRGSADMKGALAAMIVSAERFILDYPKHKGSIAFIITSDEEGVAKYGTKAVVEKISSRKQRFDWCIVGEPSSTSLLGDVVKNGRRGSLNGALKIQGMQGHIAYPAIAVNPIHLAFKAFKELILEKWDDGNKYFLPTSLQFSNVKSGTGSHNIIPDELNAIFNFRFSTESSVESLKYRVESLLDRHKLNWEIKWEISGLPFLTKKGALLNAVKSSIKEIAGIDTKLSTDGGTSDGRFISVLGGEVLELGPINKTIHQINECVSTKDLNILTEIYYNVLVKLLL